MVSIGDWPLGVLGVHLVCHRSDIVAINLDGRQQLHILTTRQIDSRRKALSILAGNIGGKFPGNGMVFIASRSQTELTWVKSDCCMVSSKQNIDTNAFSLFLRSWSIKCEAESSRVKMWWNERKKCHFMPPLKRWKLITLMHINSNDKHMGDAKRPMYLVALTLHQQYFYLCSPPNRPWTAARLALLYCCYYPNGK